MDRDRRVAAPTGARRTVAPARPGDRGIVRGTDVLGDGNCLYYAFAALVGTYGILDRTGQPQRRLLNARAIRDRLSLHIGDARNWIRYFLTIHEHVREATSRQGTQASGPRPSSAEIAAHSRVQAWLEANEIAHTVQVPIGQVEDNAAAQLYLDPTQAEQSSFENYVESSRIRWSGDPIWNDMQTVVSAYVRVSAGRMKNYATALEVELLAEAYGVVIYFYQIEAGEFEAATLRHIMYPTRQARDEAASVSTLPPGPERDRIRASLDRNRRHGFHLAMVGNHFWYGLRSSSSGGSAPPAGPSKPPPPQGKGQASLANAKPLLPPGGAAGPSKPPAPPPPGRGQASLANAKPLLPGSAPGPSNPKPQPAPRPQPPGRGQASLSAATPLLSPKAMRAVLDEGNKRRFEAAEARRDAVAPENPKRARLALRALARKRALPPQAASSSSAGTSQAHSGSGGAARKERPFVPPPASGAPTQTQREAKKKLDARIRAARSRAKRRPAEGPRPLLRSAQFDQYGFALWDTLEQLDQEQMMGTLLDIVDDMTKRGDLTFDEVLAKVAPRREDSDSGVSEMSEDDDSQDDLPLAERRARDPRVVWRSPFGSPENSSDDEDSEDEGDGCCSAGPAGGGGGSARCPAYEPYFSDARELALVEAQRAAQHRMRAARGLSDPEASASESAARVVEWRKFRDATRAQMLADLQEGPRPPRSKTQPSRKGPKTVRRPVEGRKGVRVPKPSASSDSDDAKSESDGAEAHAEARRLRRAAPQEDAEAEYEEEEEDESEEEDGEAHAAEAYWAAMQEQGAGDESMIGEEDADESEGEEEEELSAEEDDLDDFYGEDAFTKALETLGEGR